jgi:hypothetical protein
MPTRKPRTPAAATEKSGKSSLGDEVQAVLGWLKRQSTKPR